jgi:hypothetical protein
MRYSEKELGQDLKKQLEKGYNVIYISQWAHNKYIKNRNEPLQSVDNVLQALSLMEVGAEFEYTEKELVYLAELLINGEKDPLNKIKNIH